MTTKSISPSLIRRFVPFAVALAAALFAASTSGIAAGFQISDFGEAELFLEENSTDGDLGIHFKVDGEPWDRVILFDRFWHRLVDVRVSGSSAAIGLTELFNESAEPGFDELPREDFLALFPEGFYRFLGFSVEGGWLFGLTELTHTMPPAPVITAPEEGDVVDPAQPLVIEWNIPDTAESELVGVEVVLAETADVEHPRSMTAEVAPDDTSFTVPAGFLRPGSTYKIEVLVEEESGNKIITETNDIDTSGDGA